MNDTTMQLLQDASHRALKEAWEAQDKLIATMAIRDIETSAAALYDGGWRAEDIDAMISEYDMTREDAEMIAQELEAMSDKETMQALCTWIVNAQEEGIALDKWEIYGKMPQSIRDEHFTVVRDGEVLVDGYAQDSMTVDSLFWIMAAACGFYA